MKKIYLLTFLSISILIVCYAFLTYFSPNKIKNISVHQNDIVLNKKEGIKLSRISNESFILKKNEKSLINNSDVIKYISTDKFIATQNKDNKFYIYDIEKKQLQTFEEKKKFLSKLDSLNIDKKFINVSIYFWY